MQSAIAMKATIVQSGNQMAAFAVPATNGFAYPTRRFTDVPCALTDVRRVA